MGERVDTPKAVERRTLRFASPAEAIADAERIGAADRVGLLRRVGNWTAGQAMGHVAAWIDFGFDGYPFPVTPAAAARAAAYLPVVLRDGMRPGFRIEGVADGTAGIEVVEAEEGLKRLRRAWARLEAGAPTRGHAFFGPMTHEQWIGLNLRHSELHQSFFPGE